MNIISAFDRGFQYGDGLFETIVCPDGQPQFLSEHLERLAEGCRRLAIPFTGMDALGAEIARTADGARCIVKVIVTRGEAVLRGYAPPADAVPSCILLRYPWVPVAPELRLQGMRVRLGALQLSESERLAGIKHLSRLEQVLARSEWTDPAIQESLLGTRSGELISGTMSNLFIVADNALRTPRLATCGVHGVMRRIVLREARAAGIGANETPIPWAAVNDISEAFLTSSVLGVCPIRELDGRPLVVGPLTRRVQDLIAPLLRDAGPPDG